GRAHADGDVEGCRPARLSEHDGQKRQYDDENLRAHATHAGDAAARARAAAGEENRPKTRGALTVRRSRHGRRRCYSVGTRLGAKRRITREHIVTPEIRILDSGDAAILHNVAPDVFDEALDPALVAEFLRDD